MLNFTPVYIKFINPVLIQQEQNKQKIRLVITPPSSHSYSYQQFLPCPVTVDLNSEGELKLKLASTDSYFPNARYTVKYYYVKSTGERTDKPFLTQLWKVPTIHSSLTVNVVSPFYLNSVKGIVYEINSTSLSDDWNIIDGELVFNTPVTPGTAFNVSYTRAVTLGDLLDEEY